MTRQLGLIAGSAAMALALLFPVAGAAQNKGKPGGGGGGSGSSVTLVQLTPRAGGPAYGDVVTFSIVTSSTQPYVRLECYQNGTLVSTETNGYFAAYPWGQDYNLGPTPLWTGGGATCTASLLTATRKGTAVVATTSFSVSA